MVSSYIFWLGFWFCVLALLLFIYFFPTYVSHKKEKKNTGAIFVLNLLLGWTFIGWIIALMWASTYDKKDKDNNQSKFVKKNVAPTPTIQVLMLAIALRKRGIPFALEHWDGHKHVDIYVPNANLYIEVDGLQHSTDVKQMISDFNRDYFSYKEEFYTKHFTNQLIENHLDEIADAIVEVVRNAPNRVGKNLHNKI